MRATPTYTVNEMKMMIPTLDEEGIDALTEIFIREKYLLLPRDYKYISALIKTRIDFLKNRLGSGWITDFYFN